MEKVKEAFVNTPQPKNSSTQSAEVFTPPPSQFSGTKYHKTLVYPHQEKQCHLIQVCHVGSPQSYRSALCREGKGSEAPSSPRDSSSAPECSALRFPGKPASLRYFYCTYGPMQKHILCLHTTVLDIITYDT